MLIAKGIVRHCEFDDSTKEWNLDTEQTKGWGLEFKAETLAELKEQVAKYHKIKTEDLYAEKEGRLDVQVNEKFIEEVEEWVIPTQIEMAEWEDSRAEIYSVMYAYNICKELEESEQ